MSRKPSFRTISAAAILAFGASSAAHAVTEI